MAANIFDSYEEPPVPVVTTPPGVSATFDGWKVAWKPNDIRKAPMQWQGKLIVGQTTEKVPKGSTVRVEIPGGRSDDVQVAPLVIPIESQDVDQPAFAPPPIMRPKSKPWLPPESLAQPQ